MNSMAGEAKNIIIENDAQRTGIYSRAREKMKEGRISSYQEAVSLFSMIPGYRDSDLQATRCFREISNIKSKRNEKRKRIINYSVIIVITSAVVAAVLTILIPEIRLGTAQELMRQGSYREAEQILKNLGDYGNTAVQLEICEEKLREEEYESACRLAEEGDPAAAMPVFEKLGDYRDAPVRAAELMEKQYREAGQLKEDGRLTEALEKFSSLEGYLDSDLQAEQIRAELEETGELPEQTDEDASSGTEQDGSGTEGPGTDPEQKRLQRILIAAAALLLLFILAGIPLYAQKIRPALEYRKACGMMRDGGYEEAAALFRDLGDYRDSRQKVRECEEALLDRRYQEALAQKEAGGYEEAIRMFTGLNGYRDSTEQIRLCREALLEKSYQAALRMKEELRFEEAAEAFDALNGYKDSRSQASFCRTAVEKEPVYREACISFEEGNREKALELFRELNDYRDSRAKIRKIRDSYYNDACELKKEKLYPEAIRAFVALDGYRDSAGQIAQCREAMLEAKYREGLFLMKQEEYEAAIDVFRLVHSYADSRERIEQCRKLIRIPRPFNHLKRGMNPAEAEELFGPPVQKRAGQKAGTDSVMFRNIPLMDAVGYLTAEFSEGRLVSAVWHGDFAWEPFEKENEGLYPGIEFRKYCDYYTDLFGTCTSEYLKDNHKGAWWRTPRLTVDVSGYDYVTIHFTL